MILFYITSVFMLLLMLSALYGEQAYLKETFLIHFIKSVYHFLAWMLILCAAFFVSTTLSLACHKRRERFILLAANYSGIFILQVMMLVYGSAIIDKAISRYVEIWEDLSYSPAVAASEEKMNCCGFFDSSMAVSKECASNTACGVDILAARPYRVLKFLALTMTSMILQVFHGFALYSLKPDSLKKKTEFDELIES